MFSPSAGDLRPLGYDESRATEREPDVSLEQCKLEACDRVEHRLDSSRVAELVSDGSRPAAARKEPRSHHNRQEQRNERCRCDDLETHAANLPFELAALIPANVMARNVELAPE